MEPLDYRFSGRIKVIERAFFDGFAPFRGRSNLIDGSVRDAVVAFSPFKIGRMNRSHFPVAVPKP